MSVSATAAASGRDLVGREEELHELRELLALRAGATRIRVLAGEPGVGKSSLLAAGRDAAADLGHQVRTMVGVEAESGLPFAALHQLLAADVRRASALPAAEHGALLVALGLAAGERPDPFLIAQATWSLLSVLAAERPLVVLVDDLQWLDLPSREVLELICLRVRGQDVLVLATARSGYDLAGLEPYRVDVGPVGERPAQQLLDMVAPELTAAQRAFVLDQAAGNPLALHELPLTMRHTAYAPTSPEGVAASLPVRLEAAFTARLGEVPASTRDALLVLALSSTSGLEPLARSTAVMRGSSLGDELMAPAERAGLVRVGAGQVEFRHPLVRSGILRAEPLARRQAAHAALAEVADTSFERTWHLSQSIVGPDDDVADLLAQSAADALSRGAVLDAITCLERAAHLTSTPELRGRRLLLAAGHAFELGRADMVRTLVEAAQRSDLDDLGAARLQWLREIFHDGNPADATRVLELADSGRRAARDGDLDLALDLLLGAGLRCWWADTGAAARAAVVDVLDQIDPGPGELTKAKFIAALAVTEPVLRGAQVADVLARCMPGRRHADGVTLRLLGMAAHAIGDSPLAHDLLDRSAQLLRTHGRQGLLAHVLSMLVIVRLELGDLAGAIDAIDEGLHLAELTGQPIWSTGTLVCAARAEAMRGDTQRALEMAGRVEIAAGRAQLNDLLACVAMTRGLAHLNLEDFGAAYRQFRSLFDPASPAYHQRERFDGVLFLARSAALSGNRPEAQDLLRELETVAQVTPAPLLHAHLTYARAVLSDDEGVREALFTSALAFVDERWAWVRGHIHFAYGAWLGGQGRAGEGMAHLEVALQTFRSTGATTWAAQVERRLAVVGREVTG